MFCFCFVLYFSSLLLFLFLSGRYVDEVMARGTGFIHLKELGQHERVCSIIRDVNFELRRGCWVAVKLAPPFQFCSYQCIYLLRFFFISRAICWTSVSLHKHFMYGYLRKGFSGHRVPLGDRGGVTIAPNFYFVFFFLIVLSVVMLAEGSLFVHAQPAKDGVHNCILKHALFFFNNLWLGHVPV